MLQTQNNCHINTTTRTIFLGDDIDEKSMSYIQFYLLELIHADDAKDSKEKDFKREPIKMYINSHGGSVDNKILLQTFNVLLPSAVQLDCREISGSCRRKRAYRYSTERNRRLCS